MNTRYLLSFIRIMKIPGLYPIMKDWQTLTRMHFIYAAYESGLLQALATPRTREQLNKKLNVKNPELFNALLDIGLALKELALINDLFSIRGKRSKAVMGPHGDMLVAMIQANVTYYSDAYRDAADRIHGGGLGDDLDKIGDLVARVSKLAEPVIKNFISGIVRGRNPVRVLDIGCGSGILLKSAFESNRNTTGVGIDIDENVVRQARKNITEWELSDRFEIFHGDIRSLSGSIPGTFDVITLYNLLYYFDEEERLNLMNNLRNMLSPMGVLAVAMSFHSKGKDLGTANLNLVNCSLKGLTPLPDLNDITSLLEKCGFAKIKVHRFMPGSTFYGIVANKKNA